MKPMLAHLYEPKRFTTPCHIQPKLDGIRGLSQFGRFYSRDEIEWQPAIVEHVADSIRHVDLILDGEWYRHGWSLQKINSAIAVVRGAITNNTRHVGYHVFDSVSLNKPFIERWWEAKQIVEQANNPSLHIVPTHEVTSIEEIDQWFAYYTRLGYEGVIVRMGEGGYTQPNYQGGTADKQNRCWTMLKRKSFVDDEFEIVDVQEGKPSDAGSKYVGTLGALVLKARNGHTFTAGSGLTDSQRDPIWSNPALVIGKKATIQYRLLSDGGIPLNPTIKIIHGYEH